ncbi:MAG: hypothetical protein DK302_000184 [Chloroflexi bacterium]|jgi:hypothetical protein|nr:MAG: hypothetical protein DK302_000184 [Chloroflexota bacterium]
MKMFNGKLPWIIAGVLGVLVLLAYIMVLMSSEVNA